MGSGEYKYFTPENSLQVMTKLQKKSLDDTVNKRSNCEMFDALDGSILVKSDKYIESIGVKGGITIHLYIFNSKFLLNGFYSKQ